MISTFPAKGAAGVEQVTEICLGFDRAMEPIFGMLEWEQSRSSDTNADGGFRLRGLPRYQAEAKQFIIPVVLKPGASHRLAIRQDKMSDCFKSADGVAAGAYSWKFSTNNPKSGEQARQPQVVSIDPPSGSETVAFTPIRIRFDRPMNPVCYDVADAGGKEVYPPVVSVPFPVEYDAKTSTFTFQAYLAPADKTRLEFRGFFAADGGKAEPIAVEYRVGKKSYSTDQAARIVEAGRGHAARSGGCGPPQPQFDKVC